MSESALYRGRVGRLLFARNFVLLAIGVCIVVFAVQFLQMSKANFAGAAIVVLLVFSVYGGFVYSLHNVIQRLHDINRSGWYAITFYIPPLFIILLIALLVVPGSPGVNRFGEPGAA